jgi:hypothetical protein
MNTEIQPDEHDEGEPKALFLFDIDNTERSNAMSEELGGMPVRLNETIDTVIYSDVNLNDGLSSEQHNEALEEVSKQELEYFDECIRKTCEEYDVLSMEAKILKEHMNYIDNDALSEKIDEWQEELEIDIYVRTVNVVDDRVLHSLQNIGYTDDEVESLFTD